MSGFSFRSLVCVLFIACIMQLHAQGPWTQRSAMPGPGRHRAFTFTVGQRGYFGCGWNGVTMYNDFWEYDPGTDSWMQKANYPGGPRLSPFGFAVGNKGYAGAGLDPTLYGQPDFYEYNPATNQWTQKAPFIGTPVFAATAVVWNGTALIMFGDDWAPNYYKHSEIYSYTATSNTWAYVGTFPGDGRRDHVAFNINNKIYFGTGSDNAYTELNDWWEWDPGTGIMTQKPNFIGSPRSQAVGFDIGGKAYVGTGGVGDERDFFEYNPTTNSWQGIDDFAGTGRENSMSFVIGARAYIIAGTSGINFHDCWEFDPAFVTGTNEMRNAQDALSVYPNPATEKINIDLQGVHGDISYHIYTVNGQLATEGNFSTVDGHLQIPVNQLAMGEYCIVIETGSGTGTARFVKN